MSDFEFDENLSFAENLSLLTSHPLEELIQAALAHVYRDDEGYFDSPKNILWQRGGDDLFARAKELCHSSVTREREVGADILGQLRRPTDDYAEESVSVLLEMLVHERETDVLTSICYALGHRRPRDRRTITALLTLREHPHSDVRGGVVFGLLFNEDDAAITGLIQLSQDIDSDVRDWATFGLNNSEIDSPAIRDALLARVGDEDIDTRAEAIAGLARRREPHAVDAILMTIADSEHCSSLVFDVAAELRDPRLFSPLFALYEELKDNPTINTRWLDSLKYAIDAFDSSLESQ